MGLLSIQIRGHDYRNGEALRCEREEGLPQKANGTRKRYPKSPKALGKRRRPENWVFSKRPEVVQKPCRLLLRSASGKKKANRRSILSPAPEKGWGGGLSWAKSKAWSKEFL